MKRRGGAVSIAFRDILYLIAFMYLMLLVVVIPALNPPANANPDATKPAGNIAVTIAWPQGDTDIDLWVTGPGQNVATGYSNKNGLVFNLLRDDLGTTGDTTPLNFESAFSRGAPDGEYIVNVHAYSATSEVTVNVDISLDGLTLVSENMTLRPKQERTVVRFSLRDGHIVPGSLNRVFVELRSAKK